MSIPATLTPDEAMARTWDVLVVGAGPAGAVAARQCARRGLAVLLVDKAQFPRWKVCGCCLNRHSLSTLSAVGLSDLPAKLGAVPLTGVQLACAGRQARVPLPAGVALSRLALDARLVEAALDAKAAFLPGATAVLGECTREQRVVSLRTDGDEYEVSTRVVLAADGLGGGFLARATAFEHAFEDVERIGAGTIAADAPPAYQPGTIYMACGCEGYVGLVRLETGELDVAAAFDPAAVRTAGGLGRAAEQILNVANLPSIAGLAQLSWRGTPLLRRRVQRPAAERVFALGDAARFVEPFTGDGIAWALASGLAVAPFAKRACRDWSPRLVSDWSQCYRRTLGRRQRVSWIVAEIVRRPHWIRSAIRILAHRPALAWPIIRFLNASSSIRRSPA